MTSREEDQCMKLGREVVKMIRDLMAIPVAGPKYARRTIAFPGGEIELMLANKEAADEMERMAHESYEVRDVTPKSENN